MFDNSFAMWEKLILVSRETRYDDGDRGETMASIEPV